LQRFALMRTRLRRTDCIDPDNADYCERDLKSTRTHWAVLSSLNNIGAVSSIAITVNLLKRVLPNSSWTGRQAPHFFSLNFPRLAISRNTAALTNSTRVSPSLNTAVSLAIVPSLNRATWSRRRSSCPAPQTNSRAGTDEQVRSRRQPEDRRGFGCQLVIVECTVGSGLFSGDKSANALRSRRA
jgi:hypothetical protein